MAGFVAGQAFSVAGEPVDNPAGAVTITMTGVTAGNCGVVFIKFLSETKFVDTIVDDRGDTWSATYSATSSGERYEMLFCNSFTNSGTHVISITTNSPATTTSIVGSALEYTGLTATPLDAEVSTAQDTGTTFVTGATGLPAQNDEVVIAWISIANAGRTVSSLGGLYTDRVNKDTTRFIVCDKIISAIATQNETWTINGGNSAGGGFIATLKIAAGGSSAPMFRGS